MKAVPLILTSILSLTLANCAVTTAGVKKGDERNLSRSFNDVSSRRVIVARLSRVDNYHLDAVNVDVAEGIAVLTGSVTSPEARIEAERVAWSAPNIVQVGNEVLIDGRQGFIRNSQDGILEQSIRARLTANRAVKGRNFNLEIHNGIVYLLGVARSPDELARVAQIASTTRGTREVISYVKIHGQDISAIAQAPSTSYGTSPYNDFSTIAPGLAPIPRSPYASAPQNLPDLGERTGKAFPTDQQLGQYRSGRSGDAISVIESDPYYIDQDTGQEIPVSHINGQGIVSPPY